MFFQCFLLIKKLKKKVLSTTLIFIHVIHRTHTSQRMSGQISLDPPAGTRDFTPKEMRLRNWLFDTWKKISNQFNFQEYDAPLVEYQDLYTRKGGDDIIKEMFAFELNGQKLTLRPEMTPSVTRMIMKHYKTEPAPHKWFSIPQCWRNEDIKSVRKREHYQWNCDVFGAEKITSEIEMFCVIVSFFKAVGLTPNEVCLRVSNRMILQKVLNRMGVSDEMFTPACILIDKLAKMSRDDMTIKLCSEIGLTEEQVNDIYALCDIKDVNLISKFLGETDETFLEMQQIFKLANQCGIAEWLQFDASIVRGLSYYSGLVFEGFCKGLPNLQKSMCGGGRYDNLVSGYGYPEKVPAIGFGFGDVVITEVLRELGKLPDLTAGAKYMVIPFNMGLFGDAVNVSNEIRAKGFDVEIYTKNTRVKNAFDYADRKGIEQVVLIAPDEWANKMVVVKNLRLAKDDPNKEMKLSLDDFLMKL